MKFRTEISTSDAPKILSPERLVVLAGSCFSDNIGMRLKELDWPAIVNPCGVVYNPVSMSVLFRLALTHRALRHEIIKSSITSREGRYVSWFMSSKFIGENIDESIASVSEAIDSLEEGIENAGAMILTFGTPDVWLLKGTDCAVGNCHKHPVAEFEKRRVGVADIVDEWTQIIQLMRERNPELKVIFTVSPRRYLSSGFEDNTRQKAVLILACEQLCNAIKNVYYFPAYEIMNDDLRDYRFYKPDLLHPSEMAIDYIWQKFTDAYLDDESMKKLLQMEKIRKRNNHKENRNR